MQITKNEVDEYEPGGFPPSRFLLAKLSSPSEHSKDLVHSIEMKGTNIKPPSNTVLIHLPLKG